MDALERIEIGGVGEALGFLFVKLGTGAEPRLLFFGVDGAPRDPAHAGQTDQQPGGDGAGEPQDGDVILALLDGDRTVIFS